MESKELAYFDQLKTTLGKVVSARFPGAPTDIRQLSGADLHLFQEDLMEQTQGRVSEKWFYTHIKPLHNERLPRIDVLNLLSRYAGYESWPAFRDAHAVAIAELGEASSISAPSRRSRVYLLAAPLLLALAALIWLGVSRKEESHTICFSDAILGTQIRDTSLRAWQLIEGESPLLLQADSNGCVMVSSATELVKVAVQLPYYQADTLVRRWKEIGMAETFSLRPDDFAGMLRFFSEWTPEDRFRRKAQLQQMISPQARIIRMHPDGINGVEMYNKEEFIRFLMIFGQSSLEVVETQYADGLLSYLRFMVIKE